MTTVAVPEERRAERATLWSPLRHASFRYLFVGQAVSLVGDQFLVVSLPLIVLHIGGARALGQVLAAYGAARLVGLPIGGHLSDRLSRRAVMLGSDVARGLLVLALLLATRPGHTSTLVVAGVAATVGLAEGLFLPASYAMLPSVVPPDLLSRANALTGGAQNLALLVGPGFGGLLAAGVSPRACLVIDAVTFAVSTASLLFVRERGRGSADEEADTRRGAFFRFLRRTRLLQVMILCTLLSNLAYFGMLEVGLPILSVDVLHAGGSGFGFALAGFGFGSLVGSFLVVRLEALRRPGIGAIALGMIQGGLFCAVALGGGLGVAVGLLALAGVTNGVLNVFYLSRIQQAVPAQLMGRAMSALILAVFAVHPVSVAAAAALARASGPNPVFVAAGASIVFAFVIGSSTRAYRNL